jgi:drug/metabolite transporter (DMT)-like permease
LTLRPVRSATLTHGRAVALMVLVALLWSIAGVITRQLESARAFEVTFWRSAFTALSLAFILPVWQGKQVWHHIRGGGWPLWLSGVCWGVMFTAFMVALTLTTVANVLVTLAAGPLLTAVVSRLVTGHALPRRTWLAIAVAGVGIAWMFASQLASEGLLGFLVAFCVPIAGAVNWTLSQRARLFVAFSPTAPNSLIPAVAIGALLSSLATLPLAIPFQASAGDLSLLAILGLFQLAIPCVLAVVCAKVLSAPEMALLALLEVLFGTLLAWWGAGEQPGSAVLMGGSLVMGALVANEWVAWQQRQQTDLPLNG